MQTMEDRVFTNEEKRTSTVPLMFKEKVGIVRVYESSYITCPEDWEVFDLRYSYHRMYYIVGGEAVYHDEERSIPLKPGCLYVFPSKTRRYRIVQDIARPLEVLWCHFDILPEFMNGLIEYDCREVADMRYAIDTWMSLTALEKPGHEISYIVVLILSLLDRRERLLRADSSLQEVERIISESPLSALNANSLARALGYERSYFSRKFKAEYGVPPSEYIAYIKLSEAARLLESGSSITEICDRVGYEDKKAFSRAFKSRFRMSPTEYRAQVEKLKGSVIP